MLTEDALDAICGETQPVSVDKLAAPSAAPEAWMK